MRFSKMYLLGVLLVTGCDKPQLAPAPIDGKHVPPSIEEKIGQNCMVHFRRDILGMASSLPSPVSTHKLNGVELVQVGQLMEATPDWIVINFHGRELHIPQSSIQMIEFGREITPDPNLAKPE